jgi:hypothetical protein
MKKTILVILAILMVSCAHRLQGLSGRLQAVYTKACTKTDNYGTIDAYEVLNIEKKTTFEADEYIDCEDGRNLVVIAWEGIHDKTNANLAAQVMTEFFEHFHAGKHVQYLLVPEESGENVFVYKFEHYEPHRILSF